jgi:hypothetical protein
MSMFGNAPTRRYRPCFNDGCYDSTEMHMYIGGGILGTVLVICLIVWLVQRV